MVSIMKECYKKKYFWWKRQWKFWIVYNKVQLQSFDIKNVINYNLVAILFNIFVRKSAVISLKSF